ncbi:hypothetical protein [Chryseobacterium sp. G0201]|uniref:hypothetical protein n=1 Tax=Chryseobacterium sp. G0201 TaxID=2487065 RepID=UPI000F5158C4|nr:hypothetical protein [Chryseobacterium sp. G0201]AZA52626.1 hypothetical protein EG348_06210 [Chryseobacterium sp. G0201]
MIQFILMLLGLAFSNNNANTTTCYDNNGNPVTVQNGPSDPGGGTGTGEDGGPVGGNTGQIPPPFTPTNP